MSFQSWLAAAVLAASIHSPLAAAESVPYWVTDTMATVDIFTGPGTPVHTAQFSDVESHVDALFGKADAIADLGYASVFAEAQGSLGPVLIYSTHSFSRADAELNGLAPGRYRVSFAYTVLSMGPGLLLSNDAAVGFQAGSQLVELAGTGSGIYSADISINDGSGADDNWIAFFAWTDSRALQGTGSGNATLSDASVIRLPDQPTLPTPLPTSGWLLSAALAMLLAGRRAK